MLFIAIALGLVATWLTLQYLKVREQRIAADLQARTKSGPGVRVVVPVRDLPKGQVIGTNVVAAREIPADLVYAETITVDMFDKFDGAKLLRNVERGRPLRTSDVEEKGKDFSDMIEEGKRAITIDVDEVNSIAQMVKPGNLVDLYLLMPDYSDLTTANNQQVVLFMQRLKVIATGQVVRKEAVGSPQPGVPQGVIRYANMTFEVTPEQAARIALAQQLGRFRAVLRKEPDEEIVRLSKINTRNLLRKAAIVEDATEAAEIGVEYIIGGKSQSGVGNTMTVNIPGLTPPPAGATGAPGQPGPSGAPAAPAAAPPGTVSFTVPPQAQPYLQPVPQR
jgi:pilus assembly protein CpaB